MKSKCVLLSSSFSVQIFLHHTSLIKHLSAAFVCLVIVGVTTVNLGHKVTRAPVYPLTSSLSRPLTALLSTTDAGIGEIDYWVHRIVSHLARPIDIQVLELENLQIVDDSIIICFQGLDVWTDAVVRSGFRNIGLLRIGESLENHTYYPPPFTSHHLFD
jgi:hypothetical protein